MKLTPKSMSIKDGETTIILETDDGVEYRIDHSFGTTDAFVQALENSALMIRRWLRRE